MVLLGQMFFKGMYVSVSMWIEKKKIDDSFIYQGGGGSAFWRRVSDVKIEFVVLLSDWNEKVWDEAFQNGLR